MLQAIDAYQLFLIASFALIKRRDAKLRQSTASQQAVRRRCSCGRGASDAEDLLGMGARYVVVQRTDTRFMNSYTTSHEY
ncbi:hypothetical protein CUJ87_19420 [Paraburkholderia caledonica]|nr:hypothetical protein CUJ87_19420 [Paraburkholderia caledonica]